MMGLVEVTQNDESYRVKIYPFTQYHNEIKTNTPVIEFSFKDVNQLLFDVLDRKFRDAIYLAIGDLRGRKYIPSLRYVHD